MGAALVTAPPYFVDQRFCHPFALHSVLALDLHIYTWYIYLCEVLSKARRALYRYGTRTGAILDSIGSSPDLRLIRLFSTLPPVSLRVR